MSSFIGLVDVVFLPQFRLPLPASRGRDGWPLEVSLDFTPDCFPDTRPDLRISAGGQRRG
jgi:hypothetical protein